MKKNIATAALSIAICMAATALNACTSVNHQSEPGPKTEIELLRFGMPKYTFAQLDKGHAFYEIKAGVDYRKHLAGITKLRVSGELADSAITNSEWFSVSDFESGEVQLILNTGFEPERCFGGTKAVIALKFETDSGKTFNQDFEAPNRCEINTFNFISK
ncbi:MAG: hypothetical protein RLZ53_235 [Actinomycetota bacterium]|jgi:hypothetical protein